MRSLIEKYNDQNGTDECFNIIYIPLEDEPESYIHRSFEEISWFVLPFEPSISDSLVRVLFGSNFSMHQLPAVAAFGRDGFLQTKDSNLSFKECKSYYPFIEDDMTEAVRWELSNTYKWDLHRFHFPRYTSRM